MRIQVVVVTLNEVKGLVFEILRGVYPEQKNEILHSALYHAVQGSAQNDMRRAQNNSKEEFVRILK